MSNCVQAVVPRGRIGLVYALEKPMQTAATSRDISWFAGAVLSFALLMAGNLHAAEQAKPGDKNRLTFEQHVVPILKAHCLACHGEKLRKGGLDLRRKFTIAKGGDSGSALTAGKPDDSLLIEMITSGQMPPKGKPRPSAKDVEVLKQWIASGAAIQEKTEQPLADDDGTEIEVTESDRAFWSFRSVVRPAVPDVDSNGPVRTPIDAFILSRLQKEHGTDFNPDASKRVLLRRVYFDLWGLPPTPADIDNFLSDTRPDAYERLVDRLLASPRYGERWGRHWLDITGHTDSDGYLAADRVRPEAWRYRDYVIRAHNDDKPFDRFVMEQVAGDELADWRRAKEMTPELADNLIATGFLRTALDPTYGGYAEPLECHKVMADTMQIIGSTFLGLTIQCARCHSHKYDPISQKDYYRLNAILLSSYDPARWQVSIARSIPLATEAKQARVTKNNELVDARLKQLNAERAAVKTRFQRKFFDERLAKITDESLRYQVGAAILIIPAKRNAAQKKLVAQHAPQVTFAEKDIAARYPEQQPELDRLQAAVKAETALKKSIVKLRGLQDLAEKPAPARLLVRGDFNKPGAVVQPDVPTVLAPSSFQFKIEPGYKTTGRRKALAKWLVDRRNPMTARVHVNRLWAHHFGRGIVSSLDNFGKTGARPSHPQLLDWLAAEFMHAGWSQKSLHRLILTSTVYRQSSQPNAKLAGDDPDNKLLGIWKPRRIEGEAIRDSVLAVTGKLNRQMFGKPVPVLRDSDGQVTVADTPQTNRASVYLMIRRSQPVTLLELFDVPSMEINCTKRTSAIVVTQSLTMLNSRFTEVSAKAMAARLTQDVPNGELARIDFVHELLFARLPSEDERDAIATFLDDVSKTLAKSGKNSLQSRQAAWEQLSLVLLNSNEFLFIP